MLKRAWETRVSIFFDSGELRNNNLYFLALHYASKWCFVDIVETLLEYSARVDMPNKAGVTAIQMAHNARIEKMLKDAAKNPKNVTPKTNSNTVYMAEDDNDDVLEIKCDKDLKKVDKMLESIIADDIGAVCDYFGFNYTVSRDFELDRICHPLCSCPKCLNKSADFYNLMSRKLYERKMNVNTANRFGFTALHVASMYGNLDLIKILLENKANPCLKTKKGNTALHLACKNSKLNAAKILISLSNCDMIDIRNVNGDTALHIATRENNQKLVEILLDENANTTIKNANGQRPIDIAKSSFFLNIIKMLESD
jgi:ankyrin repeat protein